VRLVDVPVVAWIDIDDPIIHANVYAGNGREVAVPAQARGRNRPSLPPANLHLHQSTRSANGDGGWNRGRKAAYLHRQGRAGRGVRPGSRGGGDSYSSGQTPSNSNKNRGTKMLMQDKEKGPKQKTEE
jgi:hypothetical protein